MREKAKTAHHNIKRTCRSVLCTLMMTVTFVMLIVSCSSDDVEDTYSKYRAYFRYDNVMTAAAAPLHNALTGIGEYCAVYTGGNYLYFQNASSEPQRIPLNDMAYYQSYITIGGFIIGRTNVPDMTSSELVLVAYDLACPNCYHDDDVSKRLALKENGTAYCDRCKRTYDLNNLGLITSGERGRKLERYHIAYNGTTTVLVQNH